MKKWYKGLCCILASMLLSCSIFCSYSVPVQASVLSVNMNWVIDKVLAKCGIIANASSLSEIKEVLFTDLDNYWVAYREWCETNGKDWTLDASYSEWKGAQGITNKLLDSLVDSRRLGSEADKAKKVSDDELLPIVMPDHGGGGKQRTIEKDIGQPIVDAYKAWWEDCGGYYLISTATPQDYVSWFYNPTQYNNAVYLCEVFDYLCISLPASPSDNVQFRGLEFDELDCFVVYQDYMSTSGYCTVKYYNDWVNSSYSNYLLLRSVFTYSDGTSGDLVPTDVLLDDAVQFSVTSNTYSWVKACAPRLMGDANFIGFMTSDGHPMKVWKSLDGFKAFSVGLQNVYYSPTYTTVLDNDVTISNDYITTYANQYSYSIVQNEIDNSTTEITEETVNTIVDNSVTNITNNYYYTTPDDGTTDDGTTSGGDSVSGGDSDDILNGGDYDGLFDGLLGNLLNLVTELIEFVVKFFVKGLEIISLGFTSILNLLNSLTDSIGGIGELLGAFFPFIPQEFFDILLATISVLCGIAIYKALRG